MKRRRGIEAVYRRAASLSDSTIPQTTMRVTKRNGATRAGRRQQDRARRQPLLRRPARDVDPMRVATQDDQRPLRRRHHARARPAVDPDRRGADRRGAASTRAWPRACSPPTSTRKSRDQEIHAFSQSIALRPRRRPGQRPPARASSTPTRASSTTRSMPSATASFEYFGLRTLYDRYLLQAPADAPRSSRRRSSSSCASPARCPRPCPRRWSCTGCSRRSSTCRARRRCSTPARATSSCRAASCSTRREDHLEEHLPASTPTSRMLSKFSGGIGLAYTACARAAR